LNSPFALARRFGHERQAQRAAHPPWLASLTLCQSTLTRQRTKTGPTEFEPDLHQCGTPCPRTRAPVFDASSLGLDMTMVPSMHALNSQLHID
jgi:hypothetical protein